jgi:hypothetical protein
MRLIYWLAAGIGAVAIATAAPARPGGGSPGHGKGFQGWSNGGGLPGGKGGHARPGTGWSNGGVDHRRHHRRHGRFRQDYHVYGGAGIVGPVGEIGRYGNGYFTGGGGEIRLKGGRPHFDYDRAYPYEFASVAGGRRDREEEEAMRPAERPGRCTFENGVRVCRGW